MPTLDIGGRTVEVGDEFLSLSPDRQNAAVSEIAKSLGISASAAPSQPEGPPMPPELSPRFTPSNPMMQAESDPMAYALGQQYSAAPGILGRAAVNTARGVGQDIQRAVENPTPENVLGVASYALPTTPAYRTGRAIAESALAPIQRSIREIGATSFPAAALGSNTTQALGRGLSELPVGGGGLRRAAERTTEEVVSAGQKAVTKPLESLRPPVSTDVSGLSQNMVGSFIKTAVKQRIKDFNEVAIAVDPALRQALKGSNEDVIKRLVSDASIKNGDINSLDQVRQAVVGAGRHGTWQRVQSAVIGRLGYSPKTGTFDPSTWVTSYGNLSPRGRDLLFGKAEKSALRPHLDSLYEVSQQLPKAAQFNRGQAVLGTRYGTGAVLGAGIGAFIGAHLAGGAAPLAVLSTVAGGSALSKWLSRPAMAAPVAKWAGAYARLFTEGRPTLPAAVAAYRNATAELKNRTGADITPEGLLKAAGESGKDAGIYLGIPVLLGIINMQNRGQ